MTMMAFRIRSSGLLPLLLIIIATASAGSRNDPSGMRYFYTDSSMQQSVAFKMLEPYEQQEVQDEILHVFGLDHRPQPRRKHLNTNKDESASRYLMDLYTSYVAPATASKSNIVTGADLTELARSDVVISFLNQIKAQRQNRYLRHHRDRRFWFNTTDVPPGAEVIDAELRIFRDLKRSRFNASYAFQLTLFQLAYQQHHNDVVMQFVDSQRITGDTGGWLRFNVTGPVSQWIRSDDWRQNLGLYLQIRCDDISKDLSPKKIGLVNSRGFHKYQPFMTAYFKLNPAAGQPEKNSDYQRSRARRAANKKRSDISYYDNDDRNPFLTPNRYQSNRGCQKRTLFVSFRDLNWHDWVIAPDGYSAFFCKGDCPFPLEKHMNATNHAVVQMLMHLKDNRIPKPCCTPAELSSIMVLYFDDNSNIVLKKFKDMVVESCGCK